MATEENVVAVIAAIEASPPTIEGNKQLLDWLRGHKTVFVPAEKRSRNVHLIDFAPPSPNDILSIQKRRLFSRRFDAPRGLEVLT